MPLWVLWLVAAVALGVAEIFTLTLSLGLLAIAALVAGVAGALGAGTVLQILLFAVTAAAGLGIVKPLARNHIAQPPLLRSGVDALVGKTAVVVEEVTDSGGRVKVAGEEWSARAFDESQVIPAGARVDVMEIDGATAVVYPRELLP